MTRDRQKRAQLLERAEKISEILCRTYPEAHCELEFRNPLELLIATILSAQCTDRQVNIVTRELFKKHLTPEDYCRTTLEDLEKEIRRIGLFRNKAKNIRNCCQQLLEKHGGQVPRSMEELVELSGVGRKTANVVLGNAFHINEGIVVDTHVARLSQRLGLTHERTPEHIEQALVRLVPRDHWTLFSHWLIWHGRRRCSARQPECEACELASLCPSRNALAPEPPPHPK